MIIKNCRQNMLLILECLPADLGSQLAALGDDVGQSCFKKAGHGHLEACPCWVLIPFTLELDGQRWVAD